MISAGVTAWLGPVNLQQVSGVAAPNTQSINITCTGDGSPSCAEIAEGFTDASGRKLPSLLVSKGQSSSSVATIGAFSAGGSIAKRLALHPSDRGQIQAMLLSDATYTDWKAPGQPNPPEGFVLYGLSSIMDPHLFVATASSSPNKNLPNGSQTLESIKNEIERRSGLQFAESDPNTFPTDPKPERVWKLGAVIFADYGSRASHGEHATKLAPQVWKNVLEPWLARVPIPTPVPAPAHKHGSQTKAALTVAAFLAGVVLGYVAVSKWNRRR